MLTQPLSGRHRSSSTIALAPSGALDLLELACLWGAHRLATSLCLKISGPINRDSFAFPMGFSHMSPNFPQATGHLGISPFPNFRVRKNLGKKKFCKQKCVLFQDALLRVM